MNIQSHQNCDYDGNLLNVELDEESVKQFIKNHESAFDILADEYVKKIRR